MINKKVLTMMLMVNVGTYAAFAQNASVGLGCPNLKFNLYRGRTDLQTRGEVSKLQSFLHLNVTGGFGKVTEASVKKYQQENNLKVTGKLDAEMRNKILNSCNKIVDDKKDKVVEVKKEEKKFKKISAKYKDGEYNVQSVYNSPGGLDNMGISLTLKSDKVSNVVVTNGANDGRSKSYQDGFMSQISNFTIGQNISNLQVNVVSGASLTTAAFNDALNKIRTQAKN